jgi:membrane-bound metal-dependent hydrolase YbcI (DUF457 family)
LFYEIITGVFHIEVIILVVIVGHRSFSHSLLD